LSETLSGTGCSLIVVSAPSGTGKSTILKRVLAEVPRLRFSVSHTTRAPRPGEQDGVQYHFVSYETFEAMIKADRLLEWATVHGERYGTARAEYDTACAAGQDLLLDIDVQGAAQVRDRFEDALSVFILPPSAESLEARLRGRGHDPEASIKTRLKNARSELESYRDYDYVVVNDDLESCVHALQCIIRAARFRTSQTGPTADRVLATFLDAGESQKP
jgi:guanylate kinase